MAVVGGEAGSLARCSYRKLHLLASPPLDGKAEGAQVGKTLGPPHPAQDRLVLGGDRCGVLLGLISHQQCGVGMGGSP